MHIVPITPAKWIIHFIMSGITDLVAVVIPFLKEWPWEQLSTDMLPALLTS